MNTPIPRDPLQVPTPTSIGPAASLIRDELESRNLTPAVAARAMKIPRARFSEIFAGRKGVSSDTALRLQAYLGISARLLIQLQADHDFSKVYHTKNPAIIKEVTPA